MKSKQTTQGEPRTSSPNFTGPMHRLHSIKVSKAIFKGLVKEADKQGVTVSVVRRQALEMMLEWVKGGSK